MLLLKNLRPFVNGGLQFAGDFDRVVPMHAAKEEIGTVANVTLITPGPAYPSVKDIRRLHRLVEFSIAILTCFS